RLIAFDKGTIETVGKAISEYKSNDLSKKLSILKQANHTELNITVEQLVNFGRFAYSKGRLNEADRAQVEYALELLNLKEIRHHYLKTLSCGQRQRAYVAKTLTKNLAYI